MLLSTSKLQHSKMRHC